LAEYVKRRKQLRILDGFGTFDFDPAYHYKPSAAAAVLLIF
jgi:hypothetical protein